jgi:hypothetical protein
MAAGLIRLAVIDDQIKEDELHLLRLFPLVWLQAGAEAVFEKMPTEFGPVTLKTKVSPDGKALEVIFRPEFNLKSAPAKVVLHRPPLPGLRRLWVNGKEKGLDQDILRLG